MKKLRAALMMAACAVIAAASIASAQNATELSREEKWRDDLKFLAVELPKRHKNLFFKITREQFDREIAKISEAVPKLTDSEVKLALWRLAAMIGDAHTRVQYSKEKAYPVILYQFPDGVFAAATTEESKAMLGARLVKIGKTEIERAKEAVRSIIPVENESWFKQQFPNYLTDPEILYLLKILPDRNEGEFTFRDRKGKQFSIKLRPVSVKDQVKWIRPFDSPAGNVPLFLRNPELLYWDEY
ncbi:MAG: hypothetical protein ACRD9Y_11830, partial [Blastocatellia bacterium]